MPFSRKDYMDKTCTHREYWSQFVGTPTRDRVLRVIGKDRLLASKDEHYNDIPLWRWDLISVEQGTRSALEARGDCLSPSGVVCIAKEAARQLLEEGLA